MSKLIVDQMNREIQIQKKPTKIISIVPSQTELLHDLGLDDEIIGITKFCIHPKEWHQKKTKVGGTKNLNIDLIKKLKPDLIIGNKEENSQEDILELEKNFPIYMSDIYNLEDSYKMIADIGYILNKKTETSLMIESIKNNFVDFKKTNHKVVYLIWNEPLLAVGTKNFIHSMINLIGFENLIKEERYPEISMGLIDELKPDYLFLSSEPFPFKEKHLNYFQGLLPKTKVILVDGEMFSWYGSRLLKSKDYFCQLIEEIK